MQIENDYYTIILMKILLIYATNSGGTYLASQIIEEVLTHHNHDVTGKNVREINPDELNDYQVIILGSPSWDYQGKQGQPHEDYLPLLEHIRGKAFPEKLFAIYGLGDSSYTYFCGAVNHLEEVVKQMQGKLLVPSLRVDGFYFAEAKNAQLIRDWAEHLANSVGFLTNLSTP